MPNSKESLQPYNFKWQKLDKLSRDIPQNTRKKEKREAKESKKEIKKLQYRN